MPLFADLVDGTLEASVVGSFTRIGPWVRRYADDWVPLADLPGQGRTVLVTGANSGLGYATAAALAGAGATVRLLVRSELKARDTRERLLARHPDADVDWYVADLTDLARVREVAEEIDRAEGGLDALVHNAGAMFPERQENSDGIERTIALHVVGPHLLTHGLLDALARRSGRVIWVSSGGMYTQGLSLGRLQSPDDYRPATAYARAKRAQVVLAEQWQWRVGDDRGVTFHAMHPGWALTPGVEASLPVFRRVMGPLLRGATDGADTAVWLALADEPGREGGQFWLDRRPRTRTRVPGTATDPAAAQALWDEVERLAGQDAAPD
jgi:dehydrogenase/reductase SDR family protein 12